MTFAEFVGKHFNQFANFDDAKAAFAATGRCPHNNTVGGVCSDCNKTLQVEGTFKSNSNKSHYLDARRS